MPQRETSALDWILTILRREVEVDVTDVTGTIPGGIHAIITLNSGRTLKLTLEEVA